MNRNSLDYTILNHPDKGEYYQKIEEDFINLIFKEFSGLNDIKMPQKHNSKRLYYTNKGNISLIHCLWRKNKFQVFVTLTNSFTGILFNSSINSIDLIKFSSRESPSSKRTFG